LKIATALKYKKTNNKHIYYIYKNNKNI